MAKRIYLGPTHTPPGRKLIRAGLLGLLTLGVVSAPLQHLNAAPVATERVTLYGSPAPSGTTGTAQTPTPSAPPTMTSPFPPSMPSPTVTVPVTGLRMLNLSGQDGASAQRRLHELGVRNVSMKSKDGKTVMAASRWTVVGQSHLPGEEITADTVITLLLDQDPAAHLRTVPTKPPEPPARETTIPDLPATAQTPDQTMSSPAPAPAPGADPRFGSCREANAQGYEDYQQGVDVEYDWYEDRDHDGWVCER
ncbi:excalibur calcium-binding domain-containing protein [Streptosporangium subroseum]|uniref:excalibur calcium-binding domain-containing protein n=1 Tax=Streptosporangium subroseum TaxID=106412 RepID=UPI0034499204